MTARCEPPAELRDRDGWHWVERAADNWLVADWWNRRLLDWEYIASKDGWRYLSPVATHAEVAALRAENARLREALANLLTASVRLADLAGIMPDDDAEAIEAARAALGENGDA